MLTIIDAREESRIKDYHHGHERGRLAASPRTRDPWEVLERGIPGTFRVRHQGPRLSAAEADAEVERALLESLMVGGLA